MTNMLPWDCHKELTKKRLIYIANIIVEGRNRAYELYDEIEGDTGWTLGCRGFEFVRQRLIKLSENSDIQWFELVDPSMRFIFKIGNVPVRFYKGDAEEPNNRTLKTSHTELYQLNLSFADEDIKSNLIYRFVIETDFDGSVSSIKFVGFKGEKPILIWDVPYQETLDSENLIKPKPKAIELDIPKINIKATNHRDKLQSE